MAPPRKKRTARTRPATTATTTTAAAAVTPPSDMTAIALLLAEVAQSMRDQRQEISEMHRSATPLSGTHTVAPTVAAEAHDHLAPRVGKLLLDFQKSNPPTYDGRTDYQLLHDWFVGMEKTFMMFQCTEDDKIRMGAHQLVGNAYTWWRVHGQAMLNTDATWENFKSKMYARFVPGAEQERLLMSFINLKQGDTSVTDYEQEFTRLSEFAPSLIDSVDKRRSWFIKGLKDGLRDLVRADNSATFEGTVSAALHMEASAKLNVTPTEPPKIAETPPTEDKEKKNVEASSSKDKGKKKASLAAVKEKTKVYRL